MNKWKVLFTSRYFYLNLVGMLLVLLVLIMLTFYALSLYTRHGEKISIPNLAGLTATAAGERSAHDGFQMQITDSIFLVGKPGGLVVTQNPVAGSFAKTDRTIYITVTKFAADKVPLSALPSLYGKSYFLKKKGLEEAYEFKCEIIGYQFDPGEPDYILKVLQGSDTIIDQNGIRVDYQIDKGSTLRFILSTRAGGTVLIPDLVCKSVDEASFEAQGSGLELIITGDIKSGYVIRQTPAYISGKEIGRGEQIMVELSETKPANCPEEDVLPE